MKLQEKDEKKDDWFRAVFKNGYALVNKDTLSIWKIQNSKKVFIEKMPVEEAHHKYNGLTFQPIQNPESNVSSWERTLHEDHQTPFQKIVEEVLYA